MPSEAPISIPTFIGFALTALFLVLIPLLAAIFAVRRLKVSWRYFWYGAVIFVICQSIVQPFVLEGLASLFGPLVQNNQTISYLVYLLAAIIMGFIIEIGRYLGYRYLFREEKTWQRAVVYGVGYGSTSVVLNSTLLAVLQVVQMVSLLTSGLGDMDATQKQNAILSIQQLNAIPLWNFFFFVWQNIWIIPLAVGLAVLIYQVFHQHRWVWFLIAVAIQILNLFLLNSIPSLTTAGLVPNLVGVILLAAASMVMGLIGAYFAWRYRVPLAASTPSTEDDEVKEDEDEEVVVEKDS